MSRKRGAAGARHRALPAPVRTRPARKDRGGPCAAVFFLETAKQSSASSNSGYVHSVSPSSRPFPLSHGAPLQAPLSVPNTVSPCVCKAGWFKKSWAGGWRGGWVWGLGLRVSLLPPSRTSLARVPSKDSCALWCAGYIISIKLFKFLFIHFIFFLSQ